MKKIIVALAIFLAACSPSKKDTYVLKLTPQEQKFIETRVVTFGASTNRAPIVTNDAKGVDGIATEYLKLIQERTGLKIQYTTYEYSQDGLDLFSQHEIEGLIALKSTTERVKTMAFTAPYLYVETVMLLHEMPNEYPLKIALNGQFDISPFLEKISELDENLAPRIVSTQSDEQAFVSLMKHQVGAAIMDEATAEYLEKKYNTTYKRAHIDYIYDYSIAYQLDEPVLGSILQKGLATITPEDDERIHEKWGVRQPELPQAK